MPADRFASYDPATGEVIGHFPIHDQAAVLAAVARARAAQPWWAELGPEGRRDRLLAWAGHIWAHRSELADLVHAENGKPPADCTVEILLALEHLRWAARNAPKVLRARRVGTGLLMINHRAVVEQRPLGVIGVIAPWNYPIYTPMGSVGYALAAGNAVVLKPSEHTPAVGAWLIESFAAAVPDAPAGLAGLVTGFGDTGAALCGSRVDKIVFTGSTATGRVVMTRCAHTLTPVTLECGGKDAAIVLPDADLGAAARAIAWGGLSNAGQTCVGIERVYVHAAVRDAFVARLSAEIEGVLPGSGPDAHYGPMTTAEQADVVREHVAEAIAAGATVVSGPIRLPTGRELPPVVLMDVPADARAVAEETFGPTLTVATVPDASTAVAHVNAHRYGLAAAVFGGRDAERIARQIDVGVVTVNAALTFAAIPAVPLGGRRDSGFGRIHGAEGLLGMARPFAVARRIAPVPGMDLMRLNRRSITLPLATWIAGRLNRSRSLTHEPEELFVMPTPRTSAPSTFCEAFQRTAAERGDAIALRAPGDGTRITWAEYAERVRRLSAGVHGIGVRRGDNVALMMRNRPEFHLLDTALLHLGAVPFSIYNTSAPEQIDHVLRDAEVQHVLTEELFRPLIGPCAERAGARLLVVERLSEIESVPPGEGFDFDEAWRAVEPDDLVTLIYTSGTTGTPKGVEITHRAELAQCAATNNLFGVRPGDRLVSFLPSAHIADRWSSHYTQLTAGTELTCLADIKELAAALVDVRPHVFGAVPQVWQRLWRGICAATAAAAAAEQDDDRRLVLEGALELGLRRARQQDAGEPDAATEREWQAVDAAVFAGLRAKLGLDACRIAISGAAPVPADLLLSLRGVGIPVTNVLGLSELSGMTTWSPPGEAPASSVGRPIPGVEARTAEDGELLVRGPVLMRGYRNLPEATAATLTADGWLRTGDLARIDASGSIRIVDRKKEIMVNEGGKNLSPAAIEAALQAECSILAHAAAIGDGRPFVTALLVLDPEALTAFAASWGLMGSHAELARHSVVLDHVAAGVAAANRRLSRPEQVRGYHVLQDVWGPGSDVLTPTRKLRRRPIEQRYADLVDSLYVSGPGSQEEES